MELGNVRIECIASHPQGKSFAIADVSGSITVWPTADISFSRPLCGDTGTSIKAYRCVGPSALSFSGDDNLKGLYFITKLTGMLYFWDHDNPTDRYQLQINGIRGQLEVARDIKTGE